MELLESLLPTSTNSILILSAITLFVWYYVRDKSSYWSRRGMPSISPAKCLYQTLAFTFGSKNFFETFLEQYRDLEGHKYGGSFQLFQPCLILRDPEAVKEFLVKGFSSFHDRGPKPDEKSDKLSGNLFQLTGDKWRIVRHKLSTAFSAAKLKIMYQTLKGCAHELNDYLQRLCEGTGEVEINIKDLVSNYTLDVIGACALGIKCNAIQDPNSELKMIVTKMFRFDFRRTLYALLELVHPKIPRVLGLRPAEPEVEIFLRRLVKEAMELRLKEGTSTIRKDFLQILMNSESEETNELGVEPTVDITGPVFTEDVIVGVIGSFLSAGFEPVASSVTFCLFELAQNPEIQDKVFKEIQAVTKGCGSDISYDDLKKLHYMEQVINETLRKYPVAGVLGRNCTEPFKIPDTSIVVEKDVKLFISTYGLQHDPKYFPEPEKFDPERFSEENIDKIVPGSYIPFGDGPRFCIAMRLAMMDVKTMVLKIVSNYKLHTCPKTPNRLEFDPSTFTLGPKGGLWLRLKKRE